MASVVTLFDIGLQNRAEPLESVEAVTSIVTLDDRKLQIHVELVQIVLETVEASRLSLLVYIGGP
jgi:hypothetical protein